LAGRLTLLEGLELSGLSWHDLWLLYVGLGGVATLDRLADEVLGVVAVDPMKHNYIAHALNECLFGRGHEHPVAYLPPRP
jgi:hypothetical protein